MTSEVRSRSSSISRAEEPLKNLKNKIATAFKEINDLKQRVSDIAKDIRLLKDMFSTNDNWGAEAKRFIGERTMVLIRDVQDRAWCGRITWIDRYNIGVAVIEGGEETEMIFFKGAVISIVALRKTV